MKSTHKDQNAKTARNIFSQLMSFLPAWGPPGLGNKDKFDIHLFAECTEFGHANAVTNPWVIVHLIGTNESGIVVHSEIHQAWRPAITQFMYFQNLLSGCP